MNESFGTIGQAFHWMDRQLQDHYTAEEKTSMLYLVFRNLLNCSRIEIHERFHANLPYSLQIRIRDIVSELHKNKPIQYILGETEFYGLKFIIRPGVLIPRPETEELADWIICENRGTESIRILDVGCGSGCIAVSLAKNLHQANVFTTDIADAALSVTAENARLNGTTVNVSRHDIFSSPAVIPGAPFHVLVSNPPYIPESEKKSMHSNVRDYEPGLALFVPDNDPLIYYNRLAFVASQVLHEGGRIYMEINELFGSKICNLLENLAFSGIRLKQDINGKDRMVSAQWTRKQAN